MVRTELKRAFGAKTFWLACAITLVMLLYAGGNYFFYRRTGAIVTAWWQIYVTTLLEGFSVFYPVIVVMPYVLSYRRDRDSGYEQLLILKTTRRAYLGAKILAVAGSAFMAVLLPNLCWMAVCRLLGTADPAYDRNRHNIHFALSLYDQNPGMYCVMYAVYAAMLGAVFAILGLGLSAVVKNRYLAVFLPFCYCIFSAAVLDAIFKINVSALELLPLAQYDRMTVYPLGYWTVPLYELLLTAVGLILFLTGDSVQGRRGKKKWIDRKR